MKVDLQSALRVAAVLLLATTVLAARQQAQRMQKEAEQLRQKSYDIRSQVIQANLTHPNFDSLATELIALSKTNEAARGIVTSFGIGFR